MALPAAGLALLAGIAGIGLAASRRRRAVPEAVMPEPVAATAPPEPRLERPVVEPRRAVAPLDTSAPVPTGEAREALLEAMVAAAPDAANPFTSRKARRRRARLILQARAARQADALPEVVVPLPEPAAAPARQRTLEPAFA